MTTSISYYDPIQYIVQPAEEGCLLRTILHSRMGLSRKLVSRLKLTEQGITLNGSRAYTTVKVKSGDVIEIRMEEETSDDILPQPMELDILHEDGHLLIVNKPAGIIVHPTHGHYINTLANGVVDYWQKRGERHRFRPIHRLDQETSGVLAIAKNPLAHQQVSESMQQGRVTKRYIAIVHGVPPQTADAVRGPIDRNPENPHERIVTETGYPAVTHYRVLETTGAPGKQVSKVQLELETGRTHQIRVHMRSIGCPLIGDKLYMTAEFHDSECNQWIDRHALHAALLAFPHPISGAPVAFSADLPMDMKQLLTRLTVFNENLNSGG